MLKRWVNGHVSAGEGSSIPDCSIDEGRCGHEHGCSSEDVCDVLDACQNVLLRHIFLAQGTGQRKASPAHI